MTISLEDKTLKRKDNMHLQITREIEFVPGIHKPSALVGFEEIYCIFSVSLGESNIEYFSSGIDNNSDDTFNMKHCVTFHIYPSNYFS